MSKYLTFRNLNTICLTVCFVALFSVTGQAQIATGYEVATWYQNKQAAITYTFDDNTTKQLTTALPLFDKYNFKATFYVVTSWLSDWSGFIKASENNHEIGCHTVSHPNLDTMKIENLENQLKNSQNTINKYITNNKCVTIAYPFCSVGNMDLNKKYFISGRICSGAIEPSTPIDMYMISSIICGNQGSVKTAADFDSKVSLAKKSKGWCVFLLHGVDSDGGYSPIDSKELGTHLDNMNKNYSDYWIGTFAQVSKYIIERKAASLSETKITEDSIQVAVNDNLNDTIYNIPITFVRLLPEKWNSQNIKVYKNNVAEKTIIFEKDSKKYIQFDLIPDKTPIFLVNTSGKETASIIKSKKKVNVKVKTNPFTGKTKIETQGKFNYNIFNVEGKLIEQGAGENTKEIASNIPSGIYILKVVINNENFEQKIVKK